MKTKKVLETENSSLKVEVNDWKTKYETLSNQYQSLKSKCDLEKAKKNTNLRCNNCKQSFQTLKDFKKHKEEHHSKQDVFNCSKCDKTFNEDWKLNAHMKLHKNYQCDQCSKNFKYKELLRKHVKITHESFKLYCHYFNNKKICPYNEECVFLHEEANLCKYGMVCERMLCMFKHENVPDEEHEVEESIENNELVKSVTEVIDDEITTHEEPFKIVDIVDLDDVEQENEIANITFHNPSQVDNLNSDKVFKCKMCDFASARKIDINDHKESSHNWCSSCFSSFGNQENLKEHIKKKHKENSRLTGLTL